MNFDLSVGSHDLPRLGDIELVHKKKAHDRESRLATVMVSAGGCHW